MFSSWPARMHGKHAWVGPRGPAIPCLRSTTYYIVLRKHGKLRPPAPRHGGPVVHGEHPTTGCLATPPTPSITRGFLLRGFFC